MGIRFYCPNGHKLNVKNYLAGKRGICPHCGAKVQIPLQSTRSSNKEEPLPEPGQPAQSQPEQNAAEMNVSEPEEPQLPGASIEASEASVPSELPELSGAPDQQASSTELDTSILDEAPKSVWYVRPPSGGQYGPAIGEIMKTWLVEGRVSPDSLLWRAGWADWQPATDVFPQLVSLPGFVQHEAATPPSHDNMPEEPEIAAPGDDGVHVGSSATRTSNKLNRRPSKRESKNLTVVIVVVLTVLILLMAIALGSVLLSGPSEDPKDQDAKPAAVTESVEPTESATGPEIEASDTTPDDN